MRILLLLLVVLSPWPRHLLLDSTPSDTTQGVPPCTITASCRHSRLASAQGLSVPDESLGAGEVAAFDLFGLFEDLLELSDDFTGGKGTGSRPTRSRRGGSRSKAAFEDTQSLRQQQLELYYVAGSPSVYHSFNTSQTTGGKNYLPKLRDQGTCSTCVGHAVASAAEASVASALRVAATDWDISPQSLYYCSDGGRTCASGWQIEEALFILQSNPGLLRPSRCTRGNLVEPEIGSWSGVCAAAAAACPLANNSLPWLSCSYKALSTFWQIQQDVRQHGAAITRITIYDDFRPFFDPSKTGLENGIYTPKPGARKLYGHAAIIVGYDNVNMAWTLLNSWGTRSTKDGLFRIAMGQAGVGAPDQTYSVTCEPRAGTDLDPHEYKPWKWNQRKPVRLVNPADRTNLAAPCYYYDAVQGDTASSVADAFLVDIRKFAQDNTQVFKPVEVTADFNESLSTEQLTAVLSTVKVLQQFPAAAEPFFRCTDTSGKVQQCGRDSVQPCSGVTNCTLYYNEPDVSISPANEVLLICNISSAPGQFEAIAQFEDPADSQPRALRLLLDAMDYTDVPVPVNYCEPAAWNTASNPRSFLFRGRWVRQCLNEWVININMNVGSAGEPDSNPVLNQRLAEVLLLLENLQYLSIVTAPGSIIPPQLGALKRLQSFSAASWCWQGKLPGNLGLGWPDISFIYINEYLKRLNEGCGLEGTLPALWGTTMPNLTELTIFPSRLSGTLPPEYFQMTKMQFFKVHSSRIGGVLPSSYASWDFINEINLSGNRISGEIPTAWSKLQYQVRLLLVGNNIRLFGCIPLTPYTTVDYTGTQLTGWCTDDKQAIEQQQSDALRTLLAPLLNADASSWSSVQRAIRNFNGPISKSWFGLDGQEDYVFAFGSSRGEITFTLGIEDVVVYVTAIEVTGAGLDLAVLPELLSRLPRLRSFNCFGCDRNRQNATAMQLPATLAMKAPASLVSLVLGDSGVQGTLPPEWGKWSTLERLDLRLNSISGTLPASWKDMTSMGYLDLDTNSLTGNLPPEWGLGGIRGASAVYLTRNPGLTGTIPAAWGSFQGGLYLWESGVSGCIPDQLWTNVNWDKTYVACSQNSSEVAALLRLRKLLDSTGAVLASWSRSNAGPAELPGSVPPGYCRRFVGVGCNTLNKVSNLDLAALKSKGLRTKVSLNKLLQAISRFPALQVLKLSGNAATFQDSKLQPQTFMRFGALKHLDLSDCGLSGPTPTSLAGAYNLQHLNLSNNAKLAGTLPGLWGGLTKLQVLDISGCGVSGELPESWASMQQLKEFRASNNRPGLSGTLPESWGMLSNLAVLDINNARLTGSLPTVWADPLAMAARAASMLATTRQRRSASPIAVPGLSPAQSQQLARAAADAALATFERAVDDRRSLALGMLKLQHLSLSNSKLENKLPEAFAAMNKLEVVRLDGNMLTGLLPVAWAALKQLKVLDLSDNELSGSLPNFWGTLLELEVLRLSHNPLAGFLPEPWGGLAALRTLDLGSCNLGGSLPVTWFGLRKIRNINLSGNVLKGILPTEWGVMGDSGGYELRSLDLSNNPCMDQAALQNSIRQSKITASGRVVVNTTGVGLGGQVCV